MQHAGFANSDAMGIAICGMRGASESGHYLGVYPIKECQYDMMIEEVAAYAKGYGIPITPTTVLLHSEVNHSLKVNGRYKWDVNYSPREGFMSAQYAGEMLRERVQAVIDNTPPTTTTPPATTTPLTFFERVRKFFGV